MDYEKYYRKQDGTYMVHFPNNKGLSTSEIKKLFNNFGYVLSVDNRGKKYGLCFVSFSTVDGVKTCIRKLKNHQYIKILEHKNFQSKTNEKNGHCNKGKNSLPEEFTTFDIKDDAEVKKVDDNKFLNDKKSSQLDSNEFKSDMKDDSEQAEKCPMKRGQPSKYFNKILETRLSSSSVSISSSIGSEQCKKFENTIDETKIPRLMPISAKCGIKDNQFSSTPLQIILAQEVIVANVHPNYSIHYILHLFEKYSPISVSLMNKAPRTGIRYCHVYYKTAEDAFATMKEFDMYNLNGKKLIVLTLQKLAQLTGAVTLSDYVTRRQ